MVLFETEALEELREIGRWYLRHRPEAAFPALSLATLLAALTVGALTFTSGADATVGGGATVMGAGGGAQSTSKRETLNADGDEGACEKSTPDDKAPPLPRYDWVSNEVLTARLGLGGFTL